MAKINLGLIPSPDLPADLTSKFIDELPQFLHDTVDGSVVWDSQIIVDPLVGSAEYMDQLMDNAIHLRQKNNWDYVICLTDLPHFNQSDVVLADVNKKHRIAVISIPAFGLLYMKRRTKQMICDILNDLHRQQDKMISRKAYKKSRKKSFFHLISRYDSSMEKEAEMEERDTTKKQETEEEQTQEDTTKKADIRYTITSKLLGHLRLLGGMTIANRPWEALVSFKKIIMLAFGTGIYITLFPTPWDLSILYSTPRFLLLMFVAICSMVTWIIFAHQLWEKPSKKGDVRLRKLYNYTTITTLLTIVLINYIVLYGLFLAAIGIFVPAELFEAVTDIKDEPTIKYYFQLAWLITSLGTLAGSIGTASEDEHKIRQITYSYRQITRYYETQDEKDSSKNDETFEPDDQDEREGMLEWESRSNSK